MTEEMYFASFFKVLRTLGFRRDGGKSTAGWMYKQSDLQTKREVTVWINESGRHAVGHSRLVENMEPHIREALQQRGLEYSGVMISDTQHSEFRTVEGMEKAIKFESTRPGGGTEENRKGQQFN